MKISNNTVVSIQYLVLNEDQEEIDASPDDAPLSFLIGHHQLITGLENALIDKEKGDHFVVDVPPSEGYGDYNEAFSQEVPLTLFGDAEVLPGMQFRATTDDGEQSVIVTEVGKDYAVVDGNHPLAGMHLTFEVTVLDVRVATESELDHGHAH
jgi:FKBP-type peptidyl-prolyl cis-trans isomerase SlyD